MDDLEESLPPPYGKIIQRISEVNETLAPAVVDALENEGALKRPNDKTADEGVSAQPDEPQ